MSWFGVYTRMNSEFCDIYIARCPHILGDSQWCRWQVFVLFCFTGFWSPMPVECRWDSMVWCWSVEDVTVIVKVFYRQFHFHRSDTRSEFDSWSRHVIQMLAKPLRTADHLWELTVPLSCRKQEPSAPLGATNKERHSVNRLHVLRDRLFLSVSQMRW